jgi:GntR family transcriptional regulator, vanillate catabolism transcriptional regulator
MSTHLTEAIVRIREQILRGELAPGQRVAEAPLAEQLGMSRTPVRQALPLLANEGLRAFTSADVLDAIDVRAALEGLAARRVAERGASKAFLRELRNCLEDGEAILGKRRVEEADEALYAEMNQRFHSLVLTEADSPILSDAIERNNRIPFAGPQALAFDRSHLDRMYDQLRYAHHQHYSLVEAFERGQGARAEGLMREHAHVVEESINLAALPVAPVSYKERA